MATETLPALETRDAEAMAIVYRNMMWAGGAGVLPFPLFDLAAITGVQIKLVKELADFYGIAFMKNATKSIILSLLGTLTTGTLAVATAVAALKFVPVVGQLVALFALPGMSAAITYAVGRVFIQHFEAGGTILDLDPGAMKEYFRQEFEKGKALAKTGGK